MCPFCCRWRILVEGSLVQSAWLNGRHHLFRIWRCICLSFWSATFRAFTVPQDPFPQRGCALGSVGQSLSWKPVLTAPIYKLKHVEALSTVGSNTGQNAAKSICVPFQSHCISFPALRDCTPVLSLCLQWRWRHYHAIQASYLSLSCLSTEEMRASQLLASCKGIHLFPMLSITLADVLGKESCRFLCLLMWLLRYCCRVSIGLVCMGTVLVCSPTSPFFLPGSHYFLIPGVDLSVIQMWEELSWTLVKVCYSLELWISRDSLRNP